MYLQEIRKNKGLTQTQLTDRTGISQTALSFCENGILPLSLNNCIHLEELFGAPIDWVEDFDKEKIKTALSILIDHYPVRSVVSHVNRMLQQNISSEQVLRFAEKSCRLKRNPGKKVIYKPNDSSILIT